MHTVASSATREVVGNDAWSANRIAAFRAHQRASRPA